MTKDITDHSQAQQERLAYIELNLWFLGQIRRQTLVKRFQIKAASATRDLALYSSLNPDNLSYDLSAKTFFISPSFKPMYSFSTQRVMTWLAQGFADGFPGVWSAGVPALQPARLGNPHLDTLGVVTRAIFQRQPLRIRYQSLNGESERVIVPHVLVDNGLRWHVRGFDRKTQGFRDFVVTRIIAPEILDAHVREDREGREADSQWNHQVTLEMVHHPDQPRPEVTHLDYGMQDGVLKMTVKALTAGYTLRQWSVDCSPDHRLRGHEYRLWLRNHEVLKGVHNALLAPGFTECESE
ncbi:WYL domain-containing protein [Pseudomonas sp. PS01300]|uniref:helix-turn-helix transcriptional regulator n=1 Tax=Pseudomonas sp. PS01300 TaxID=2991436 RepID=UPI00249BD437|nr:WYL domain-containing protein [Pseudomonas sp. PS01300]